MAVTNIMLRSSASIHAEATLADAAAKMRDKKLSWLHLLNGTSSVGVVSDRDIVTRAAAKGLDPLSTKVRDVMSSDVLPCSETEEIMTIAIGAARKKIESVTVLDGDRKPVGRIPLGHENQ